MNAGDNRTGPNPIDLEASRWLALMERGPLPPHEQDRFAAWVAADIRHQGAMVRAQAASLRLDRLAAFAGGRSVVEPLPEDRSFVHRGFSRRGVMMAAAASAAGLMGIGAWLAREPIEEIWGDTWYASGVGELKEVALPDGSTITLNTHTQLRVRYTSERRDIRLVRGEALFAVIHDAQRPFVVRIDDWAAIALGTAFVVRGLDEPTKEVMVTEGVVQLLPVDPRGSNARHRLIANQKALIDGTGKVQVCQLSDTQLGQQLAWRSRLVVFAGEPLRQALAEMNRYSHRRIVVSDPTLAERRIEGVFSTGDTQTFISAMTATLRVQAVEHGEVVLLRPTH